MSEEANNSNEGNDTSHQSDGQESGAGQEKWTDGLPEGLVDAPFFKGAESLDDALGKIRNAADHMGNSLRIPSEEASDEDRAAFTNRLIEKFPNIMLRPNLVDGEQSEEFYRQLGRPEKAEDYKYDAGEEGEMPEDLSAFAQAALEQGLTQAQFQGIVGKVMETLGEASTQDEAEHRIEMKTLSQEWGLAFDQNRMMVKNFLDITDAPEGLKELLDDNSMSANEIRWLHGLATSTQSMLELVTHDSTTSQTSAMTPSEASSRINEILGNPQHPYNVENHPDHAAAVQKMLELHRFKAGAAA